MPKTAIALKLATMLTDSDEPPKEIIKRLRSKQIAANLVNRKFLPLGSVSNATLNSDHLIHRFTAVLRSIDPKRADGIEKENADILANVDNPEELEEYKSEFVDNLMEVLQDYCPEFTYFGTLEGDGADFGVWISPEALEAAVNDKEVEVIPEEDPRYSAFMRNRTQNWPAGNKDAPYFLFNSANGSMSLYDSKTHLRIWET